MLRYLYPVLGAYLDGARLLRRRHLDRRRSHRAEVHEDGRVIDVQHDVSRLDVAVGEGEGVVGVEGTHPLAHAPEDAQ